MYKLDNEAGKREDDALGYIKEARLWMQAEKARYSAVRMRDEDWKYLIDRLLKAEQLLDPPKDKK